MDVTEARKLLGKRLRHIRLSRYKHLSANKISKLTGLSRDIIARIEGVEPKCNVCGYTIDSLLKYKSTFKMKLK